MGSPSPSHPSDLPLTDVADQLRGVGFDRVQTIPGSTYRDCSTIVIMPTREPKIDFRVVQAWQQLIAPMNQKRAMLFCYGDEVGIAYERLVDNILGDRELSTWKYIMTVEADNLPPPDAHIRLLESIEAGKFDGVSGLYFTKGEVMMPMAYGSAEEYKATGVLDFRPLDVRRALASGNVMEVNGIAMGCSLYRLDLFREIPKPWFMSISDVMDGQPVGYTQDLFFCRRARLAGKRFAVDMRVKVGHLDLASGIVY